MKADRDWMIQAACREHPPDDMFPGAKDKPGQRWAIQICHNCPVQTECAQYAIETGATHGIWAGEYRNQKTHQSPSKYPPQHGTESGAKAHYRKGEKPCDRCATAQWEARKRRLGAR